MGIAAKWFTRKGKKEKEESQEKFCRYLYPWEGQDLELT